MKTFSLVTAKSVAFGCFLSLSSLGLAQTGANTDLSQNPSAVVPETATKTITDGQIVGIVEAANKGEIDQGKLAQKTSKTKAIKDFAAMMVKDHTQVNKDLKAWADKAKVRSVGSQPKDELVAAAKDGEKRLKAMKGPDFDKAYAADQVTMHQTVLDSLDSTLIPNAQNADLKAMLTKVRASVASHLDQAKALSTAAASQM